MDVSGNGFTEDSLMIFTADFVEDTSDGISANEPDDRPNEILDLDFDELNNDSSGTIEDGINTSTLFSIGYLNQLYEETDTYEQRDQCIVPQEQWKEWIQNQETEVLLLEIKQDSVTHILCVGGFTNESDTTLFLPKRCFLSFDITKTVDVSIVKTMPPHATKITLKPLDNELYHCDIASAVSKHLSHWQVLTKWTTLTVPCEELGGYLVDIFVSDIEPANIVLLRDEVPLELDQPIEDVVEFHSSSVKESNESKEEFNDSKESNDEDYFSNMIEEPSSKGFVPFSGTGNRLGG
jgi:hypothetical protein